MLSSIAIISGLALLADTAVAAPVKDRQIKKKFFFDADAAVGDGVSFGIKAGPGSVNGAFNELFPHVLGDPSVVDLRRQDLHTVGTYPRACDCRAATTVRLDDIRGISEKWAGGGDAVNVYGISNMIWGFGQFLDHDLALTIEKESGKADKVATSDPNFDMELHRAETVLYDGDGGTCKRTLNAHTPLVDAGPVYGSDEHYVQHTLREPGTCLLRTSIAGGEEFLPVTTKADDQGRILFIAGDVRVSEHAFLAAQHTVWVREHNRLCRKVDADQYYSWLPPSAKFDIVRNVVIAKFQQVVLNEFLPALGISKKDVRKFKNPSMDVPDVSMEFSIAYRLGHDLIGDSVGRYDIVKAFDAEKFFLKKSGTKEKPRVNFKNGAGKDIDHIFQDLATTECMEFDGKLSGALRNNLFMQKHDLAGRNIYRARDLGIPTYAGLARCFGVDPNHDTEDKVPDAWLGLLHEPKDSAGPLPPTLRTILIDQFHRSFYGPGGLHWKRDKLTIGKFEHEIKRSTYAKIIRANTGAQVKGNVFKVKTKKGKGKGMGKDTGKDMGKGKDTGKDADKGTGTSNTFEYIAV